jgi:hypothetical protein
MRHNVMTNSKGELFWDKSQKLPIDPDTRDQIDKILSDDWPIRQPTKFEYKPFPGEEMSDPISEETKEIILALLNKTREISPEAKTQIGDF